LWRSRAGESTAAGRQRIGFNRFEVFGREIQDLGADHFDRRSKEVRAKRLVGQLANPGFEAKLTPLARAA